MKLAINVAAMLIAFLALLAMINFLLGRLATGQTLWETLAQESSWDRVRDLLLVAGGFVALLLILNRILIAAGRPPLHRWFGTTPAAWGGNLLIIAGLLLSYLVGLNFLLAGLKENLQLKDIFSSVFAPLAFLIGVPTEETPIVADLLGIKIAANEFLAFMQLRSLRPPGSPPLISNRSLVLASYALTGFANFGSVGIQIGGIGALAPDRRSDLARLGMLALVVGFLVTLINASVAGMLSDLAAAPAASLSTGAPQ
jgi:nucleoside permease NupC